MITVQQLIEQLNNYLPETVVIMSSDAEGNSCSPLASLTEGVYYPDTTWNGEFYAFDDDDESDKTEYDGYDDYYQRAVMFIPVN